MFPNRVYVRMEDDVDGSLFPVAEVNPEEFAELGEDIKIGVYDLREVAVVRTGVMVMAA